MKLKIKIFMFLIGIFTFTLAFAGFALAEESKTDLVIDSISPQKDVYINGQDITVNFTVSGEKEDNVDYSIYLNNKKISNESISLKEESVSISETMTLPDAKEDVNLRIRIFNKTKFKMMVESRKLKVTGVIDKKQGIPVLMYHSIENKILPDPGAELDMTMAVTPEEFKEQMKYLKDQGYNTITYDQLYDFMKNGSALPEKPIVISFDDGYYSNYYYAYKTLRELGMKAEIAVVTGVRARDKSPELMRKSSQHFTWRQAEQMQQSGVIDIQSHTVLHKKLAELSITDLKSEVINSKKSIESHLGNVVNTIVYPNGSYNANVVRIAKSAGYKMGVTIEDGLNYYQDDTMRVKRIMVTHGETGERIVKIINSYVKK